MSQCENRNEIKVKRPGEKAPGPCETSDIDDLILLDETAHDGLSLIEGLIRALEQKGLLTRQEVCAAVRGRSMGPGNGS